MIESKRVLAQPSMPERWHPRLSAAAALMLGLGAVAGWMALRHDRSPAPAPKPTRTFVEAPLRPLVFGFPHSPLASEASCPEGAGRVPLVSFSAIMGEPLPLEHELFPDAATEAASVEAEGGRVAVLRTTADDEHEGAYDGRLVVFDGATRRVLCEARIRVDSYGDLRWADVSPRALHRAHVDSIRRGVLEAGVRLSVELRP
jgi:hypothetical protein